MSRAGILLGAACYTLALLVFALLRRADEEPIPSLLLAIASSLLLYAAGRSLAFGPRRDPLEVPAAAERSIRIGAGVAGAIIAVTLHAFLGGAIASAVALVTLMPVYLAIHVLYDSRARTRAEPATR